MIFKRAACPRCGAKTDNQAQKMCRPQSDDDCPGMYMETCAGWLGYYKSRDLVLHVKDIYFQQTRAGLKPFEFRLRTEYWRKRLVGRDYDRLILMSGYPPAGDTSKILVMPYRGYEEQTITHPHFGDVKKDVFAIRQEVPPCC